MNNLDGIKDFIEDNKEVLENMNQEMKASYGRAPLIWMTVDEVFTLKQMIHFVLKSSKLNKMNKVFLEKTYNFLNKRFEEAESE